MCAWVAAAAFVSAVATRKYFSTSDFVPGYLITFMQPTYSYFANIRAGAERKKFGKGLSVFFCQEAK